MMKMCLLLILFCAVPFTAPSQKVAPLRESRPSAKAWLVTDLSGSTVIRYNNQKSKLAIASTTKLLTALQVIKEAKLKSWVKVSAKAAKQVPSKIGLKKGERWSRGDLLKALLVKSANDAATALAEDISGSEKAFCLKLDKLAKSYGCSNTHILRASGLPAAGQYSTASDLALITKQVYASTTLKKLLGLQSVTIKSKGGRKIALKSNNRFLKKASAKVKGKTGYTKKAQRCFSGVIEIASKKYIVVFLGSKNLWKDLALLRTYAIEFDKARLINKKNLTAAEVKKWQTDMTKKELSPGKVDGVWGVKTQNAFLKFQDKFKLYRDGVVGQAAKRHLS